MTPGLPTFADAPKNLNLPEGKIAQILRECLQQSEYDTQKDLAPAIGYSTSTIADMLSGRRSQSHATVDRFIDTCIPDPVTAQQRKDEVRQVIAAGRLTLAEVVPAPPPLSSAPDPEPDQPRRNWWTRRKVLAAAVALLVVIGIGGYAVYSSITDCGGGISRTDGQCIGVSDASVNLTGDDQFADLFAKIYAENQRVLTATDSQPVVSVAYAAPFPKDPGLALGTQLRQEIEGAYLAQLQANGRSGPNPLAGPPRVQLLIANLGNNGEHGEQTVADLVIRTDPGQAAPLVAVTGLDQSVPGVKKTIELLGKARIPMVAGRLVLDDITPDPYRDGFYGVAPSIKAQVTAGAKYLGATAQRPLIVVDRNPDDLYGVGLANQLRSSLQATNAREKPLLDEPYDASLQGLDTTFAQMSPSICIKNPDIIYFAGRGTALPGFIRGLGVRACQNTPIKVFTASDGRILAQEIQKENHAEGPKLLSDALKTGIRVLVTAQAHPGKWTPPTVEFQSAAHVQLSDPCDSCFPTLFPGQSLDDGDTIIGHDAMLVVVTAMRRGSDQQHPAVNTQTVRQALARITPEVPVYGASGPIGYTDQAGFPVTKPIPLTEVTPDGAIIIAPQDASPTVLTVGS